MLTRLFVLSVLLSFGQTAAEMVSSSASKLPMGLGSIIKDLQSDGASEVSRVCLITSQGVTNAERVAALESIFGVEGGETGVTAFGTDQGFLIASPLRSAGADQVASAAVACGGTIVYVPSSVDLARGEGLFMQLAPVMERLLATGSKASIIVMSSDPVVARSSLQQASAAILPSLVQPRGKSTAQVLEDVFSSVEYVTSPAEVQSKLRGVSAIDLAEATTAVAGASGAVPSSFKATISARDLAAARKLGPTARTALESALSAVQDALESTPLVTNFGQLCEVTIKRAVEQVDTSTLSSPVASQIKSQLKEELYSELSDVFSGQLDSLDLASFEAMEGELSKLKLTPTLPQEMDDIVVKAIGEFGKAAKKLVPSGASSWSTIPARTAFAKRVREFCSDRLLRAKASGQYRPFPRKGVSVGMHWLLPKPFGNDFRQEPWMVHATDNMVYVPPDKVTNVSPEEVKAGDWTSKIVPSPSTREMVYVQ